MAQRQYEGYLFIYVSIVSKRSLLKILLDWSWLEMAVKVRPR